MPEASGLDLCRHIRSDRRIIQFPIIMHTASAIGPTNRLVFDQLISKPVDLQQLSSAIEKLLLVHSEDTFSARLEHSEYLSRCRSRQAVPLHLQSGLRTD
jgi:CheY-like chemotaxis protein